MVIWGTGNVCNHILKSNPELHCDFFLDNDWDKVHTELYGKMVFHPSQVQNWAELYIIVAVDNYIPIMKQLEEMGLETEQFIWYRDYLFPKSITNIEKEAERFLDFIEKQAELYQGKSIIFSDFLAFDKGVCDYVNKWKKKGLDAVLLSEAYWIGDKFAKEKVNISVHRLPAILSHNQYVKEEVSINDEIVEYVASRKTLKEASQNLRMGYAKMAWGYENYVCYWADRIVRAVIAYWKPKKVIVWNAFYAFHTIIRSVCHEKNVPLQYLEFGHIPGTIQLEELGQMGESYPARFSKEFLNSYVSEKEYVEAENLVKSLCKSKLNRNVQPKNDLLTNVNRKLVKGQPVIVYAGQNDNAAGMQPYTLNTKMYHSPIFESSDDAAIYLACLCEKNNWNYIYKPHPMMMENFKKEKIPSNAIIVNNVDINDLIDGCNIIVTIVSTVSYIALIRNKPVVMLGYTQLKEKGCTYEAFEYEMIEAQLKAALQQGVTDEMKSCFIRHIAQIKKYYKEEERKFHEEI